MAVPKVKVSKARRNSRKANWKVASPSHVTVKAAASAETAPPPARTVIPTAYLDAETVMTSLLKGFVDFTTRAELL